MKKLASIMLALVMVLSLAACGNEEPQGEEATTKAADSGETATEAPAAEGIEATISVQVEEGWLEYYQAAVARVLAKNPNAEINLLTTGSFDHLDVLDQTDVTNEDVADVFAYSADRLYPLAQNEALAALDAETMAANVGGFDDYQAGLGGNLMLDGDYLGFPMNIETLLVFANQANADTHGVDLTQPIEFTELEQERMIVAAFNAWFGVALTNPAEIEYLGMMDDGALFSDLTKDFSELSADKQATFTALFNYWKGHDEAGTSAWDKDAIWGYMDAEFATGGKSVAVIEGPWNTTKYSELADNGENLVVLPLSQVTMNGKPLVHWKGGWALGINARVEGDDAKMSLAQAMIEEIVNPEHAVEFFEATGKIMENVPADVYANSELSDVDKVVVSAVIEGYQGAPARPLFTEWGQVWTTWENALLSWGAVKPATVEEAYTEVKAAFDALMLNF